MEFVCTERGISAEDYLKEIEENYLSKLFDKYKKEYAQRLSKGESLSNLSLGIAEDIAEMYNQEYSNIVPGVIATVERNVESDKTTYAVKLKDAHHAYTRCGVFRFDKRHRGYKRSAKIAASKALKEKIEVACKAFGIDIQQVVTNENSNWSLVKDKIGKIVSVIQYVNGIPSINIVETLTEGFAHALIAGMSNTKVVSDLLDLLYYKPKSVQTILNIMSHSDEDDYDVYSAIYSGNYEHYYQLILEAAGKLFKARILQEYDLLYKLDFCDLFDVQLKLAPIYNLLIDIYKDKNNVNALEQAYENGLEAAKKRSSKKSKDIIAYT